MAIQTFTLENGMQVLLEENHASKVVSFNALVKVGSRDESDAEAGVCHVIEHMLFKGTPTRPAGTIARDVEAAGGEINAYTSIDQTVFYVNMATQFADKGLQILADAIRNPLFDSNELDREKEVILEEIRREQDNPSRMLGEHLFNTAYEKHPYGRPIIGFPHTVKSFTREQIMEFYRKWYSPKNMVFIAVGDFESKVMIEDIRRLFAGFDGAAVEKTEMPRESLGTRPKLVVKEMNIQSAYLAVGFHIPEITHSDVPALDVLAHILGGADSSRLEQEIKEKRRLVHNVYAYSFTPKDPGLFVVGAMLADADAAKTIAAIGHELERVKAEPVTSEELSRAKLNIRSSEVYEKETVGGQGSKIAYFLATAGSHEFERRYYQMLADVGSENVRDVASRYLKFESSTTVLLVPEESKWTRARGEIEKSIGSQRIGVKVKVPATRPKPLKIRLKNGATLVLLENHNLPLVSICAAVPAGTRSETKATNGISGLTARVLTKGTSTRTAVEVAKGVEKLAGHIDGFAGRNAMGLKCEFLSEYLHEGFSLFSDVLARPAFAAEEVGKEKRLTLHAIKDQEDALASLAFAEFLKALYPKHPYGLRLLGTRESVKRFSRADLVRYHREMVRAASLVLAVVGDVNREEVEKLANELLAPLPRGRAKFPPIEMDERPKRPREVSVIKRKKQQAHIVLGFQGTTYKSDDRYALSVLNNILAGQGGRLFLTLRDKMSLAYSVSSMNQEGVEPGYIAVYIGTEPGKEKTAVSGILAELRRISTEHVSEEEIERSKQFLVGTYELDLQRNGVLANICSFNELYDIGLDEIEQYPARILSVSQKEVLATAKKYITPDAYVLAVVRPS